MVALTWPYKDVVWYVGGGCTDVAHVRREKGYTNITERTFLIIINCNVETMANKVRRRMALNTNRYDRSVEVALSPFHHRYPVASEANAAAQSLEFATIS